MQPYYYILIIYFKIWIRASAKIEKNTRDAAERHREANLTVLKFLNDFKSF